MAKKGLLTVGLTMACVVVWAGLMLAIAGCNVSTADPFPVIPASAAGATQPPQPTAAAPVATDAPSPLPAGSPTSTFVRYTNLEAVVKPGGADFYYSGTGGNPDTRLKAGSQVKADARTKDGKWIAVVVGQGTCIDPTPTPVPTEYPYAVDELRPEYSCYARAGWVKAEDLEFNGDPMTIWPTGDPRGYDYLTATPTFIPTPTETPVPFVFVTATPNPPGCWKAIYDPCIKDGSTEDACRAGANYECNPKRFADPQVIPTVRQVYEDFFTFISFRNSPPPADFAEQLKTYMEPGFNVRALSDQCSYESVVGHISSQLAQGKYIRISGEPVWKEPYRISSSSTVDVYYQVRMGITRPSLRFEVVDIKSGRVLNSGVLSNNPEDVFIVYFTDSKRWRLAASDYCNDLEYAFPHGY